MHSESGVVTDTKRPKKEYPHPLLIAICFWYCECPVCVAMFCFSAFLRLFYCLLLLLCRRLMMFLQLFLSDSSCFSFVAFGISILLYNWLLFSPLQLHHTHTTPTIVA